MLKGPLLAFWRMDGIPFLTPLDTCDKFSSDPKSVFIPFISYYDSISSPPTLSQMAVHTANQGKKRNQIPRIYHFLRLKEFVSFRLFFWLSYASKSNWIFPSFSSVFHSTHKHVNFLLSLNQGLRKLTSGGMGSKACNWFGVHTNWFSQAFGMKAAVFWVIETFGACHSWWIAWNLSVDLHVRDWRLGNLKTVNNSPQITFTLNSPVQDHENIFDLHVISR